MKNIEIKIKSYKHEKSFVNDGNPLGDSQCHCQQYSDQ